MAKSDPRSVVAGVGLLAGIFTALRDKVVRRSDRDIITKRAELIVGQDGETYELEIDYGGAIGVKRVRFCELAFDHDALDDEVLARMVALHCRQPEEIEARKAIGRYTSDQLRGHPRIGLIGPAVRRRRSLYRACVIGNGVGVNLSWHWTGIRWYRHSRFVVVWK